MNNPDVVVREAPVELRIFVFRHVAGDAMFFAHGTGGWFGALSIRSNGSSHRAVAGKTLRVIKGGIVHERLMRIVTCNARDARVGPAPAAALRQPVRLETDIERTVVFCRGDIQGRAMTGAAKIDQVHRPERPRIKDCLSRDLELSSRHRLHVPGPGAMACFARDSRRCLVRVETLPH